MGIYLDPNGNNSFTSLAGRRAQNLFVDKTAFIAEIVRRLDADDTKLIALALPRRFGKTVTVRMLAAFFSRGADSRSVFEGLAILTPPAPAEGMKQAPEKASADTSDLTGGKAWGPAGGYTGDRRIYLEHLNRHHVIFIDMNAVSGFYRGYLQEGRKRRGVTDLVSFLEFSVIEELRRDPEFGPCIQKSRTGNTGLLQVFTAISQDLGVRFVFIMDEWDLIYREYRSDPALQYKFISLLVDLFKSTAGLSCFSLVYLTGILPTKKNTIHSQY